MIPRLVRLIFLLPCVIALGGCAQLTINGNIAATMLLIPIYLDDGGMMNRAGTTYYDSRWYADPDSHPAVRPPRKPPEAAGAAGPASRGSSTAAP